jgi:hypothetical protein
MRLLFLGRAPANPFLQWPGKLLPRRCFSPALRCRSHVVQLGRPQAELDSYFRFERMIEKLTATLCTFPVFCRGLHGLSHICLSNPIDGSKRLAPEPSFAPMRFPSLSRRGSGHPPPAPFGGMLDTRPTPVWLTSASAVC